MNLYASCHVVRDESIVTRDNSTAEYPLTSVVTNIGGLSIHWRDCDHAIAAAEKIKVDALAIKEMRAASETSMAERVKESERASQSEPPAVIARAGE